MNAIRLSILVAVSLLVADVSGAPLFRQTLPIDVGGGSGSLAGPLVQADFNGDGFPDVAAAHPDGRLVVALTNGFGPFAPSKITAVPTSISRMAAADIDRDGDIDLVYVRSIFVGVLLGKGDGTFTAGSAGPMTAYGPIALGDVNGDARLDLVAVTDNYYGAAPEILVHLGDGSGGFAAGLKLPTPQGRIAIGVSLADLNGDTRADVVVSGPSLEWTYVFLSRADGTLQNSATIPGGPVAVGRFNADATPDLAVLTYNFTESTLDIWLGQGNGTFVNNSSQPFPAGWTNLSCADFTGDAVLDVASISGAGLSVARGHGDGSFSAPRVTSGFYDRPFVTGDFDRDGKRDVVAGTSDSTTFSFLPGNGDGTFRADRGYVTRPGGGLWSFGVSAADMNGDGRADASTLQGGDDQERAITVAPNDGSGGLLPAILTPTGGTGETLAFRFGFVNGDSRSDAVMIEGGAGGKSATSFLGNGDGTFTRGPSTAVSTPLVFGSATGLADMTGDGVSDLLIDGSLYEGNGDGSFDAARATGVIFSVTGDLDGNGIRDVVWRNGQLLAVSLNTGGGVFSPPVPFGTSSDQPVLLADFDGDGALDLFCLTDTGTRVYGGRGDGTFRDAVPVAVAGLSVTNTATAAADFNGDGKVDVTVGATVLLGTGDGRFRSAETPRVRVGEPGVADFDANGSLDFVEFMGAIAYVHLTGVAAEPVRSPVTTITPLFADPVQYGKAVTYRGRTSGDTTPVEGTMTYRVDGAPIAIVNLQWTTAVSPENAASSVMSVALPAGTHTIAATYDGSAAWLPSTASTTLTVERAMTTLKVANPPPEYGTKLSIGWTLTAPVVATLPGPSTTAYTLTEGGAAMTGVVWSEHSVTVSGLAIGSHTLVLDFTGDANYKPSSTTFTIVVAKRTPSVIWKVSPEGAARVAGPVTIAVELAPKDYGVTTGNVTFSIDGSAVGTAAVVANRAEITVNLPAGAYTAGMSYGGDLNNSPVAGTVPLSVYGPAGSAPSVVATFRGAAAELRWAPAADAVFCKVYQRALASNPWSLAGYAYAPGSTTVSIPPGTTRMYAIAGVREDGSTGPAGAADLATAVAFTDDPLVAGATIRAAHITQLRTAVNAVRTFAGLPPFAFTDAVAPGMTVRALHMTELRAALVQARTAIGMPMTFTAPSPSAGERMRISHIEDIRAGVR
jgi:hypothetical protein